MRAKEVYEKYKHLDALLSDRVWTRADSTLRGEILYDLWQAVKESQTLSESSTEYCQKLEEVARDFKVHWNELLE